MLIWRSDQETGQLIVRREELARAKVAAGHQALDAGFTALYSTPDNHLIDLRRSLGLMEHIVRGYKVRYDVSLADHEYNHVNISASLPSRNDTVNFTGHVSFGFRVRDPEQVVRRRIFHGYERVISRLKDKLFQISREFDVTHYESVQGKANESLGSAPILLPEGIEIYRFVATIRRNPGAIEAARRVAAAKRGIAVAGANFELKRVQQQHGEWLERQATEALRVALQEDFGPLRLILARNPENVLDVLKAISESSVANAEQKVKILDNLIDHDLVQDIDVAEIREALTKSMLHNTLTDKVGLHQVLAGRLDR